MRNFIVSVLAILCAFIPLRAQETSSKINKKNLVIKEWKTDARGGGKMLDHITTFNSEGRKCEETEYNSDGQKWRKRYEYGADGRVSRELVYDGNNRLVNIKKFEYTEFGRKKIQYTYDAKGRLKSIKNYEYIPGDA